MGEVSAPLASLCLGAPHRRQPWWDADLFAVGRLLAEHRSDLLHELQPYAASRAPWRSWLKQARAVTSR